MMLILQMKRLEPRNATQPAHVLRAAPLSAHHSFRVYEVLPKHQAAGASGGVILRTTQTRSPHSWSSHALSLFFQSWKRAGLTTYPTAPPL